jgi:hypothetical protein
MERNAVHVSNFLDGVEINGIDDLIRASITTGSVVVLTGAGG